MIGGMLVMNFCLRRRPDLSWEQFSDYWRDVHAPLVASHADLLGIRRYVQLRTLDVPGLQRGLQARNGGSPEPYDGVAQVWIDDLEALRMPASDEGRAASAALLEDERNFIDLPNSPLWVVEETVVVP
jgi:uncharacterized protein (TIGR02118 family)